MDVASNRVEVLRVHLEPRTLYFHPSDTPLPPGMVIDFFLPLRATSVVPVGRRHESFDHADSWTVAERHVGQPFFVDRIYAVPPPMVGESITIPATNNASLWEEDEIDPPPDEGGQTVSEGEDS